ncbi:MAG: hypothetical protein HC836_42455 [Richelia sp. RM2_1_2]|nr:hypothetical protein [Richelia sp. SM2_1_7]NJM21755.1 hypothetical protein [Richelia sp. SM1_7_0]NJN12349.1 hypothetical protein [Richelia sp. RM1_1_1]NJO30687.1 hypothetical protein [Richelia sp. SL_2_1]NJO64571.1 hypothetical protein [Richelia sp. RM2_1_2]
MGIQLQTRQIGATLTEADYQSAKILAAKKRTTLASVLREALVWYLQDNFELLKDDEMLKSI